MRRAGFGGACFSDAYGKRHELLQAAGPVTSSSLLLNSIRTESLKSYDGVGLLYQLSPGQKP